MRGGGGGGDTPGTQLLLVTFDFILQKIGEEIRKEDIHFRKSISPEKILLVTLRLRNT